MPIAFNCPLCKETNSVGPEFAGRRGTCAFCGAAVIVPQASGEAQLVSQPAHAAPKNSSAAVWIIVAVVAGFVLLACGGMMIGLLLPAVNAAREAGRRAACMNKLKQLDLALLNYQSTLGRLPPAAGADQVGNQPMSWRVAILPFILENGLYKQYDPKQPWNSPKNLELVKQMPSLFRCPSDSSPGDGETSYVMLTGPNTVGGTPGSAGVSPQEIVNGPSRTIAIVEVHGLKIPWTEPRDITLDELTARLRSGGRIAHIAVFNVAMADGSVQNLSATIDAETLRRLATINNRLPVQIDKF
jgi:hypothetical protein